MGVSIECALSIPLFLNDTARNFRSRIPGRLRVEIIRVTMHNYSFSYNILHTEAIRKHFHICFPIVSQQRWKVSGVLWVHCIARIQVTSSIRKTSTFAATTLMDMESEKRSFCLRKTVNFNLYHYSIVTL